MAQAITLLVLFIYLLFETNNATYELFISNSSGYAGQSIQCLNTESCAVTCKGNNACAYSSIHCPSSYSCDITCYNNACNSTTFYCPSSSKCTILCSGDSPTCAHTHMHCPSSARCYITCEGNNACIEPIMECPSSAGCYITCEGNNACFKPYMGCDDSNPCHVRCEGNNACNQPDINYPEYSTLDIACTADGCNGIIYAKDLIPTNEPSINPYSTDNPSANTTPNPTSNLAPTLSPNTSLHLSSNPSINPSRFPIIYSTIFNQSNESISNSETKTAEQSSLHTLNTLFSYTNYSIIGFFIFIILAGLIDAKLLRPNDIYSVGKMCRALFHAEDTISDIFLCFEVSTVLTYNQQNNNLYLIILILLILFTILPILLSILQLFNTSRKFWSKASQNSDEIKIWLRHNVYLLYITSILTGSSFCAVQLFNTNLFGLTIFNMGLSEFELSQFQITRFYSIVLLENIPQLILQFIYWSTSRNGQESTIVIISMIYSSISIIITIIAIYTQKKINYISSQIQISFNITGNEIMDNAYSLRNRTNKLREQLSILLGLNKTLIEIIRPNIIKNGLNVSFTINTDITRYSKDFEQTINDSYKCGTLACAMKNSWNLQNIPKIDELSFSLKRSRHTIDARNSDYQLIEDEYDNHL